MDDIILLVVLNLFPAYMGIHYARMTGKQNHPSRSLTEEVRQDVSIGISFRMRRRLVLIAWFLLWIMINVVYFALQRGNDTVRVAGMLFIAFALVLETLFLIQEEEALKQDQELSARILRSQADYYERQYRTIAAWQDAARRQRHERKNQALYLLSLAEKGDCQAIIRHLEQEQQGESMRGKSKVTTGNFTVDAVLNYELEEADKLGIRVSSTVSVPGDLDISGTILCGILGNALDNAMEACARLDQDERQMEIWMKVEKLNLMIEVRNRYDGVVNVREGRLLSRKEDRQTHGIGIRVMEEMIRQTNGTLETDWDENWFTLRIVVYHVI